MSLLLKLWIMQVTRSNFKEVPSSQRLGFVGGGDKNTTMFDGEMNQGESKQNISTLPTKDPHKHT